MSAATGGVPFILSHELTRENERAFDSAEEIRENFIYVFSHWNYALPTSGPRNARCRNEYAFTGCAWLQSSDGGVDLTVFNQTDTSHNVAIGFFDDSASEGVARAYSSSLDVEPDGEVTREAVVETGRYLVRYTVYEENSR